MIKESMYLFLLIGSGNEYNTQYVGKVPQCIQAEQVVKKLEQRRDDISGYLCLGEEMARKKFNKTPNPAEQRLIKDIKNALPEPIGKPKLP